MEKTYNGVLVSEIQETIESFYGSDESYRHGINRKVIFSQGARYVAESCGACWLIDEIAIAQFKPKVRAEEFQVWKLAVIEDSDIYTNAGAGMPMCGTGHKAVLTLDDGNGNIVLSKPIPFTDFPLPEVTLWVENNTIYLPSEH